MKNFKSGKQNFILIVFLVLSTYLHSVRVGQTGGIYCYYFQSGEPAKTEQLYSSPYSGKFLSNLHFNSQAKQKHNCSTGCISIKSSFIFSAFHYNIHIINRLKRLEQTGIPIIGLINIIHKNNITHRSSEDNPPLLG